MSNMFDLSAEALRMIFILTVPFIAVGGIVGGLASLLQDFTYLKDKGLTFAIKLIAIIFTGYFVSQFGVSQLITYTEQLFKSI